MSLEDSQLLDNEPIIQSLKEIILKYTINKEQI